MHTEILVNLDLWRHGL